jgi:hypothetical protein
MLNLPPTCKGVPGEFRICRHFHPRVQDELSQCFDFPIFKRSNQIETGVLAPAARSRPEIVPPSLPRQAETSPHSGCRAHGRTGGDSPRPQSGKSNPRERSTRQGRSGWGPRPRNYSWAELMHRVWAIDVLECPRCLGRMRILAAIHPPDAIRAYNPNVACKSGGIYP